MCSATKNPWILRGLASGALIPLILRITPPELAPFLHRCKWVAGLRRAVSLHLSWWEHHCTCSVVNVIVGYFLKVYPTANEDVKVKSVSTYVQTIYS